MSNPNSSVGKPPKSDKEIRNKLEKINRSSASAHPAGPFADPKRQSARRAIVASFYCNKLAGRFQSELGKHEIYSEREKKSRQQHIFVEFDDLSLASELAVSFKAKYPDRRPLFDNRRFDLTILGTILGLVIGMITYAASSVEIMGAFVGGLAFIGACIGQLCDRARLNRIQKGERWQWSIWESLLVVGIVSLILGVCQILPEAVW